MRSRKGGRLNNDMIRKKEDVVVPADRPLADSPNVRGIVKVLLFVDHLMIRTRVLDSRCYQLYSLMDETTRIQLG
jgi:hypothetical protein